VVALEQLITKIAPAYVVFPHTYQVRDYAPALAARFGQTLLPDVIAIRFADDGTPIFVRQLFQGRLNGDYRHGAVAGSAANSSPAPCFVSVQAGAFRAESVELAAQPAPIESFSVELTAAQIRTAPSAPFRESTREVDLASAPVIVSVGRGIREQENIALVQALADALGGELAASRPICDAGWLPMDRQVGSSGQTVAPKAVPRGGHLRGDPAPGGHEGIEDGDRHQQGRERADLRGRRLRRRGRPVRDCAGVNQSHTCSKVLGRKGQAV